MNQPTQTETPVDKAASQYPFPWTRHNNRLRAANGNTVAIFSTDLIGEDRRLGESTPKLTVDEITDNLVSIVYRGDIIEQSVNQCSRRRNEWLEKRVAVLEQALKQAVIHWDSAIAYEGTEFSPGSFDSVKDGLEDWRNLLSPKS